MQTARAGRLEPQAVEVVQVVAGMVADQPGRHGEGADGRQAVDDQIKQDRAGGVAIDRHGGRDHPDEQITGVGDRRIGQEPLQVRLGQGGEVAEGHRQRRDQRQDADPAGAVNNVAPHGPGVQRVDQDLHHRHEAGDLRAGGDPGRDRSRGPLVGVGRPLVERDRRDLEPEADEHQKNRHAPRDVPLQPERGSGRTSKGQGDPFKLGRSGQAVQQAQTEQEHRRGDRAIHEIFQAPFGRPPPRFLERRDHVETQRHHFERQEQRQQFLGGDQEHHPHARPAQQGVVFAPVVGEMPGHGQPDDQRQQSEDQDVHPHGQGIAGDRAEEQDRVEVRRYLAGRMRQAVEGQALAQERPEGVEKNPQAAEQSQAAEDHPPPRARNLP